MGRYASGLLMGLAAVLLLGAAGDDGGLEKRLRLLENQFEMSKGQVDRANSRLTVLEARVAALEKKLGAEPGGTAVSVPTPLGTTPKDSSAGTTPVAPPATAPDEELVPPDPLAAFVAEQDKKKVVLYLRTANYTEIDGVSGLWVSALEHNPAGDRKTPKVLAVGKLRYVGSDDLKEYDLTLQLVYRNKTGRTIGLLEFDVPGNALKPDRDHVFRQVVELSEEYSITGSTELKFVKKIKVPLTGRRSSY